MSEESIDLPYSESRVSRGGKEDEGPLRVEGNPIDIGEMVRDHVNALARANVPHSNGRIPAPTQKEPGQLWVESKSPNLAGMTH